MNNTIKEEKKGNVSYSKFMDSELRIGRVKEVYPLPEAPLSSFYLIIDMGEYGIKRALVDLQGQYSSEDIEGRLLVVLANISPTQKGNLTSDVEVIKVSTEDGSDVLIRPDWEVSPGCRVL